MRIVSSTALALMLALLLAVPVLADGDGTGGRSLTIAVSCDTNPETVTITNNLGGPLSVGTITSLVDPGADEPYFVPDTTAPAEVPDGETVTYFFGEAPEGAPAVTTELIFDDDADDEGVEVGIGPEGITGEGGDLTFRVLCEEGSRTFVENSEGDVTQDGVPALPDTGAGGMAGGVPFASILAAISFLVGGGYLTLRRR